MKKYMILFAAFLIGFSACEKLEEKVESVLDLNPLSELAPETYFHTGYTGTSIVIDPVNDVSVIVLTNSVHPHDGPSAARMRSLVCNIVAAAIVK